MQDFTRRNILSSGLLVIGALTTQPLLGATPLGQSSPDWIATLEETLRNFSTRISRTLGASGEIELHCEMADPFAFGNSHGNLPDLGVRIIAQGNRLSFKRDSVRVAIVLNLRTPPNFIPA